MAKPKLALIPAAQGDKFYSVLPSDGVGDFNFTRNSSATRIAPTGFIQEVGAFGSELVTNGNFDNDSDWLKATGWSISGGKAVATAVNNGADLVQNIGLVNGKSYKIEVTISGYVAGSLRINFLGTGGNFGDFTANGTYIGYADGGSDSRLQITATTTTTTLSVDNVSVIEVIGNKSRLNYDLLNGKVVNCPHYLLEPASTNLINYSQAISNTPVKNGTFVDNFAISPDGTQNATKLTATNTDPYFYQNITFAAASYTSSIYVKGIGDSIGKEFRIVIGSFTTAPKLVIPSEWTRFEFTATLPSGSASTGLEITDPAIVGDEVLVWGWQVEQQSYATSYIPTNGTAITRAAESATGSGDAATFNDSEGVLMVEFALQNGDNETRQFGLSNGSDNESIKILQLNASTIRVEAKMSSGSNFVEDVLIAAEINNKYLIQYKADNYRVFVNGFAQSVNQRSTTPIGLDRINFDRGDGASDFYGKTREVQYFDSALTDAQLETLTSWTSLQEMITSQLYTNY